MKRIMLRIQKKGTTFFVMLLIILIFFNSCSFQRNIDQESDSSQISNGSDQKDKDTLNTELSIETIDFGYGELGYNEVLSGFRKSIIDRLSDDFENEYNSGALNFYYPTDDMDLRYAWGCMLIEAPMGVENPSIETYGYVLNDINADGVAELFLMRKDHTILAIFTSCNGKAELLGAYWPRLRAVMPNLGTIYVRVSGGAYSVTYYFYKLEEDRCMLTKTEEFGIREREYYQIKNGEKHIINITEYEDLLSKNPFENSMFWKNATIMFFGE